MRLSAVFFGTALAATYGQEWWQWRGPARNGVAPGYIAPATWPKRLTKLWSVPAGGGFSSPVASTSAIFLLAREGETEVAQAVDHATGKLLWKQSYPAPFQQNRYATEMGKGPHSTPVFHQDRVFTLGITGVLTCWDAKSGTVIWRKDFSKRIDATNLFTGTAMSPMIEGGLLIVHIGDDRGGSLMALDPATGTPKWTWDGDGPSYSSPIAADISGVRQIIALTLKNAVSVDARTGALLWKTPFQDQWNENIVTPVVSGSRVIFSGVRRGTFAVEVKRSGAKWSADTAWTNAEFTQYMSSPILDGDHLFGFTQKRKGQFFCMDARTGALLWSTPGREGANASLVSAGPFLLALNETGDLKIIRRNPAKYESVAEYKVSEESTWPQPLLLGSKLIVKDARSLTAYEVR